MMDRFLRTELDRHVTGNHGENDPALVEGEDSQVPAPMQPLHVKRLHEEAALPRYATAGAACFDLVALVEEDSTGRRVRVLPAGGAGGGYVFRTGLAFEVPPNHVLMIYSRSGHGFTHNVRLANCVGVIDSDYRGEVLVKLSNDSAADFSVSHGDRIAQAMLVSLPSVALVEVDDLAGTERGARGFGSTGA